MNEVSMNEVSISKDIVDEYYRAVKACIECEPYLMKEFLNSHPNECKILSAIHRRRTKINNCIKAIESLGRNVYWGTLTFNSKKDVNLISTKRKQAFTSLNKLFDYFLLVEEFGEKNNRYHIHFLGALKYGMSREDLFKRDIWSSRRDIQLVDTKKNISGYLVKYMSKTLPRIRTNKLMCELLKAYKKGVRLENLHFDSIGVKHWTQGVNVVTVFDLDL